MAKMGSQKLSERKEPTRIDPLGLFTDRENPQEAFERKFRVLSANRKDASCVLCYYGIGGVGKTTLLTRLCHVLDGDPGSPRRVLDEMDAYHVSFDFGAEGISTDKRSVLTSLRNQINQLGAGFQFYLFDTALVLYAKKAGVDPSKDSATAPILEQNPWLNGAVTAVGALPVVGWVSNTIQAIDTFATAAKGRHLEKINQAKNEEYLRSMYFMEASELLAHLHDYFIHDMYENMEYYATKPLVIFLDTYEQYVDTINSDNIAIVNDYWLRKGENSVIQSIPGILWVIMGRERLGWAEDDPTWGGDVPERPLDELSEAEKEDLACEMLEQHLLGDLSEKDAVSFLHKAGIVDDILEKSIYELTGGTPLFLDICVRQYESIAKERKPVPADFGTNLDELVNRYLFYMPSYYKEMAMFLASLEVWNDELVEKMVERMSGLRDFTMARYRDFLSYSFVIKNQDNSYYIHETVRKAALTAVTPELEQEIASVRIGLLEENLNQDAGLELGENLEDYLFNICRFGLTDEVFFSAWDKILNSMTIMSLQGDYEKMEFLSHYLIQKINQAGLGTGTVQAAQSIAADVIRAKGDYRKANELVDRIMEQEIATDLPPKIYYSVYRLIGNVKFYFGEYKLAAEYDQKAYEGLLEAFGPEDKATLCALNSFACDLGQIGEYKRQLELATLAYEGRKKLLGESSIDTITSLSNLGGAYSKLGDYQKALELKKRVHDLMAELYGEEHRKTIGTLSGIASQYTNLGRYQEALELDLYVYEKTLEDRGEKHPITISKLNMVGVDYSDLGEYQKALEIKTRVYELRKEVLGEDNGTTINTLAAIATEYTNLGMHEKALELDQQVYEYRRRTLGEREINTIRARVFIATDYSNLGRYREALEICLWSLELYKELLGEKHPSTIGAMKSVAVEYSHLDMDKEAMEMDEKVLALQRELYGEEHPGTISAMLNLSVDYSRFNRWREAIELDEKVVEERKKILGERHPETLSAMLNLATDYSNYGREQEAVRILKPLVGDFEQILGPMHPKTLNVKRRELSISYSLDHNATVALTKAKELLPQVKSVLGEDHPDTKKVEDLIQRLSKKGDSFSAFFAKMPK